jgi:hypothetical protein
MTRLITCEGGQLNSRTALLSNPAWIISICALSFTIFSFWWIHRRPGKLVILPPRSFELWRSADDPEAQLIVLPIVFFNKGAMPVIVRNLRLIHKPDGTLKPFTFQHVVDGLGPARKKEHPEIATQFPVRGGDAVLRHIQFMRIPSGIEWREGTHNFRLDAVLGSAPKWRPIIDVDLRLRKSDITHANAKRSWLVDNMRED